MSHFDVFNGDADGICALHQLGRGSGAPGVHAATRSGARRVHQRAGGRPAAGPLPERPPAQRLLPAVLLLKATVRALAQVPQLNGFCDGGAFRPGVSIHVGWAISMRGGGLVAPAAAGCAAPK